MATGDLDTATLHEFLAERLPELAGGPLTAELITGGKSNLTYVVAGAGRRWILRRPPLGHVLATAHDMAREYRVLAALAGTAVPVPQVLLLNDDPEPLGAPFYLMSEVRGTVYRSSEGDGAAGRGACQGAVVPTGRCARRPARDRAGERRPGRLRPAGRVPRPAGAAVAHAVGRVPYPGAA